MTPAQQRLVNELYDAFAVLGRSLDSIASEQRYRFDALNAALQAGLLESVHEQRALAARNPRNARPGRGERATDEFLDAIETARAVAGDDVPLLRLGPGGDFTREVRG